MRILSSLSLMTHTLALFIFWIGILTTPSDLHRSIQVVSATRDGFSLSVRNTDTHFCGVRPAGTARPMENQWSWTNLVSLVSLVVLLSQI